MGWDGHTGSTGGELDVAALHAVELLSLFAFCALLDHAIAVRELSAEDVAEDLGVAVWVGWKSVPGGHAVFVEDAQTAEVVEAVVVVIGEAEGVEGFQPAAVFGVAALAGAAGDDGRVSEGLGHVWVGWEDCFDEENDER